MEKPIVKDLSGDFNKPVFDLDNFWWKGGYTPLIEAEDRIPSGGLVRRGILCKSGFAS
jgi:hypothetical protein